MDTDTTTTASEITVGTIIEVPHPAEGFLPLVVRVVSVSTGWRGVSIIGQYSDDEDDLVDHTFAGTDTITVI